MDYATRMAFRAIVSGLHHAGTIDQRHVSKIVEALAEADATAERHNRANDRPAIRTLCMEIARDAQVECPIHDADPPAGLFG